RGERRGTDQPAPRRSHLPHPPPPTRFGNTGHRRLFPRRGARLKRNVVRGRPERVLSEAEEGKAHGGSGKAAEGPRMPTGSPSHSTCPFVGRHNASAPLAQRHLARQVRDPPPRLLDR